MPVTITFFITLFLSRTINHHNTAILDVETISCIPSNQNQGKTLKQQLKYSHDNQQLLFDSPLGHDLRGKLSNQLPLSLHY